MKDRIVNFQICPNCTETRNEGRPIENSRIIEMEGRRICGTCGSRLSLHATDALPDELVAGTLYFIVGRYGFRLQGDTTVLDQTRCKHPVYETRHTLAREDGAGCVLTLFELPVSEVGKVRSLNFSRKGLMRDVPDSLLDVAEMLTNEYYGFALSERQLGDSPMFLRFERRYAIPQRGVEQPKCLVVRIELNWTSMMFRKEVADASRATKRKWGTE